MLTSDERQPGHLCDFVCSETFRSNLTREVSVKNGCSCVFRFGRVEFQSHLLQTGHQSVKRSHPELLHNRRCRLVVLGIEAGGKGSNGHHHLFPLTSEGAPRQHSGQHIAPNRHWCPHRQMVYLHLFCNKLVMRDINVGGLLPPQRIPRPPAKTQPPLKEHGLDLATSSSPAA